MSWNLVSICICVAFSNFKADFNLCGVCMRYHRPPAGGAPELVVCVCSGTAPLACLVTMLHSQVRGDRVKNSIFFKLPGRMSLFTLKVLNPLLLAAANGSLASHQHRRSGWDGGLTGPSVCRKTPCSGQRARRSRRPRAASPRPPPAAARLRLALPRLLHLLPPKQPSRRAATPRKPRRRPAETTTVAWCHS